MGKARILCPKCEKIIELDPSWESGFCTKCGTPLKIPFWRESDAASSVEWAKITFVSKPIALNFCEVVQLTIYIDGMEMLFLEDEETGTIEIPVGDHELLIHNRVKTIRGSKNTDNRFNLHLNRDSQISVRQKITSAVELIHEEVGS